MKPKKPRPRKPRERGFFGFVAVPSPHKTCQQPDSFQGFEDCSFYRLPELELRGGNLLTDGCRRVLDFTPQRICLDMGDTLVTLYGADLRIESFAGKRLIAAGRFARIELRSKWEVPQE